jgi:tetratricopeptide (TPR) repeat protein
VSTFPDDVGLGLLLEATSTGWQSWFEARGPVDLVGRAVGLDAAAVALDHLTDLPAELRGLSLAGLPVTDQQVTVVVQRMRLLSWLDLRGTQVTEQALTSIRRLRRLRRLGLDEAVLSAAGRRPAGTGLRSGVSVVTEGGQLLAQALSSPIPDTAGFNALLSAASAEYPGAAVTDSEEARARSAVLLDAGRPEQALALLAPMIVDADPGLLLVAARSANEIGTAAQALAPLTLGPPTVDLLAWRGIFLSRVAPAQAVLAARAALREAPDDSAALWAVCSAYLNAGQIALAERALADLQAHRPEWPDTAKLAARLARVRHRYRDEIAAWHRVLADQPDDADALAGLARAQRSARPLSMTWMTTLNSAATVDVRRHGQALLEQVTTHRRHLARVAGTVTVVGAFLLMAATPGFARPRIGLLLVAGLLVASLTAGLLWRLTPAAVRQVVRRTDDLTGARRGPDWRRVAVAGTVAGLALAVPIHVPTAETCGGRLQSPCAQPASRPVFDLPPVKIPPIKLPTIAVPTFSPIPNRISNPFPVPEMSVRP